MTKETAAFKKSNSKGTFVQDTFPWTQDEKEIIFPLKDNKRVWCSGEQQRKQTKSKNFSPLERIRYSHLSRGNCGAAQVETHFLLPWNLHKQLLKSASQQKLREAASGVFLGKRRRPSLSYGSLSTTVNIPTGYAFEPDSNLNLPIALQKDTQPCTTRHLIQNNVSCHCFFTFISCCCLPNII